MSSYAYRLDQQRKAGRAPVPPGDRLAVRVAAQARRRLLRCLDGHEGTAEHAARAAVARSMTNLERMRMNDRNNSHGPRTDPSANTHAIVDAAVKRLDDIGIAAFARVQDQMRR